MISNDFINSRKPYKIYNFIRFSLRQKLEEELKALQ
jgi:hypothetical protein